ncbi:MAG: hypothetical protein QOI66_3002 [Myxococcales bacterium]|jgi:hypothetical protein|nr:hypothetical protein [Myxococcales bacterium]
MAAIARSADSLPISVHESAANLPGHTHALEASVSARTSSRLLLLVGGATYVSWHWIHRLLQPDAVDPLGERLIFLAISIGLVVASYHRALKRHLVGMGYIAVALGTAHYFSLVARNQISTSYLLGAFVVLGAVGALLVSARAVFTYAAFAVVLALGAFAMAGSASMENGIELVVGTATVQIGVVASSWRNKILKDVAGDLEKARRELRQLRGLLPICMHCNRIRNKGDQWEQFENYVEAHTEAAFTHALCQDCANKHYPDI